MELNVKYMTRNDCFTAGRKITPKGIMVHSTATPGVMAADWFSRWNKSYKAGETNRQVAVHAFVDDRGVWQYLPWNHRGWHAGGAANNTHIGFEICEPGGFSYGKGSAMVGYNVSKNEAYFRKAWQNAVELCVMLCRQYDLTEEDIICHSEGAKKGIASNHGDVMHWFPKHGESMNSFRAAVNVALNKTVGTSGTTNPSISIQVGDVVEVKSSASTYYPGGASIPAWVKTGSYHKVTQIISNGKPVVKGGKICVLLGKKVDKKNGKESAGIMSWIDVGALNIVKSSKPPDNQKLYRVQVGAFSNRGNADALLKKLKSAGFTDAFIK
ncbi:peptidoglycan-binding protein LysM [Cytobacillus firmus]|nr:N-acetylmuramoyl-L-alanine amidase [Cytobacillus firmus]MBG9544659.1 peptidoglycan-binding protein LysM [Cytobacillus firmus]MBG9553653.1 peptidoglycan-binding protein LysM [Cytobacillus firmus]MBG9577051.1 peptidoglycan-binding protein LysM [Cytobacillus firmus]MED4448786.1 N-acetylmuramoyl-L-alanine amidase [Cytobacillus firmus]MED4769317.1 N-acetylmuramoyl-L-alanine amidase [Cytobacillus firmus]